MRALALFALCGCNQFFGLEQTKLLLPDAAGVTSCPSGALGAFTGAISTVTASPCQSYTTDVAGTRAVAYCNSIVQGVPDSSSLAPSSFEVPHTYDQPKLGPTGDVLYVRDPATLTYYALHDDNSVWSRSQPMTFVNQTFASSDEISVPTDGAGTERLMMISVGGEFWEMRTTMEAPNGIEWNIATGGFTATSIGLATIAHPMITHDGLRLIFTGAAQGGMPDVYILERAKKDQPWLDPGVPPVRKLYAAPDAAIAENTPFLRSDCGRIYYSKHSGGGGDEVDAVAP